MRALQALAGLGALALCVTTTALATSLGGAPVDMPYTMTVRVIDDSKGVYQVEVDNGNPYKYVNSYVWTPPGGMTITKILSSVGGTCVLAGNANTVSCVGAAAPPGDLGTIGAGIVVTFTATGNEPTFVKTSYGGYFIHYGVIGSVQVHEGGFADLPLCKKGHTSTASSPCAKP